MTDVSRGSSDTLPSLDAQTEFWNGWNEQWRGGELDAFASRQRAVAVDLARREGLSGARILDVGCGTGWLADALSPFGRATGTDLSTQAIELGKKRYPNVTLLAGDFLSLDLAGGFDLVVSADVIAHVYEQARFVRRVAELLRPGGMFLLMTQNPVVWTRNSKLSQKGAGQIRDWPSLGRLRALLEAEFTIEKVSSIAPGGDRGLLFWVEHRFIRGGMRRLVGRERWDGLLERALLGRELVIVARRRAAK